MKKHPIDYLESAMDELLPSFTDLIVDEIKKSAKNNGFEAGGDLISSVRSRLGNAAIQLQREVVGEFNFYGRYHDLKYLAYDSQWVSPNTRGSKYLRGSSDDETPDVVLGMEHYIKKMGGMAAFKYTPGRFAGTKARKTLSEAQKIRRLAWSFAAHKLKQPKAKNTRKKKWYTVALQMIRNKAAAKVRELTAKELTEMLKTGLESGPISL